jgi:predicted nucleic acid-binding protein
MIVADVNLIVYLLTDTSQHSSAVELFRRDPGWRVPPLWRHEMLNVIATLTRQTVLEEQEAFTLWRNALDLFKPREELPDAERALSLSIHNKVSAYDAQYVALAEQLKIPLITEDKKLQKAFPSICQGLNA